MQGRFRVKGLYVEWVPGCSVLLMLAVSAEKAECEFGGEVTISPEGKLMGTITDEHGAASVRGEANDGAISFQKTFVTGWLSAEAAIHYSLARVQGEDGLIFVGGYRFVEDAIEEDGKALLGLTHEPA